MEVAPLAFNGYQRKIKAEPNLRLTQVGRGTPAGEYHRRYWVPMCFARELGQVPLRVRALGEDLVVFRDGSGRVGVLHLNCCHRNASLEFGIIEQCGLRCAYHGRLFDVDGRMLEIPGEPPAAAERLKCETAQGAYPTHEFGGIVFAYMGPPEKQPIFPMFDRFMVPGMRHVPDVRWNYDCNWLQVKENTVDAFHTNVLHTIPQRRGMAHFSNEFKEQQELTWVDTGTGVAYFGARLVGDNIWVRSVETFGSTMHMVGSIFESGHEPKPASHPWLTIWTLPIDDTHTTSFLLHHVGPGETMPFEERCRLLNFGQNCDRPYAERQWIPGDWDALMSQGPISPHESEQLGTMDRGVVMYRRTLRRGIEAVEKGEDPHGVIFDPALVPTTLSTDSVTRVVDIPGQPRDPEGIRKYVEGVYADYRARPPMSFLS